MPDNIYEVVAQAARYWFLFLMALIVWRSLRWLNRDRKQQRKRLKRLPDAGYIGELVVLTGNADLPEGLALPVSNEGILGCLRGDDVYVPVAGVAKKHLWYTFNEDDGLRIEPYSRRMVVVDGKACTGRRSHAYGTHGSVIAVGDAELRLRLFAGFEYAGVRYAAPSKTDADVMEPELVLPSDAQPMPPPNGVTFTPEQVAMIQQMNWAAAMQAFQAMQARQNADTAQSAPVAEEPEETALLEAGEPEEEPARASARHRRAPLPPLTEEDAPGYAPEEEPAEYDSTYGDDTVFYPPEPDVSDYPEEDEAPRSLYLEPDEAENAKRLVWDKYLKGGRRQ